MATHLRKSFFTLLVFLLVLMIVLTPSAQAVRIGPNRAQASAQTAPVGPNRAQASAQTAPESMSDGLQRALLTVLDTAPLATRPQTLPSPDEPTGPLNPAPLPSPSITGGDTIQAGSWLTETVDSDGRMERRVAVDIFIGDFTIYLPLVEKNGLGTLRLR